MGKSILQANEEDPYLWLEEAESEKALLWAKDHNARSNGAIEKHPRFQSIHERLVDIYNSNERIPHVSFRGPYVYNFWQEIESSR